MKLEPEENKQKKTSVNHTPIKHTLRFENGGEKNNLFGFNDLASGRGSRPSVQAEVW